LVDRIVNRVLLITPQTPMRDSCMTMPQSVLTALLTRMTLLIMKAMFHLMPRQS